MPSRLPSRRLLKAAIAAYCVDGGKGLQKSDRELLSRLTKSTSAARAFARLKPKNKAAEQALFDACVEAHRITFTFSKRLKEQEIAIARAMRWKQAVVALRDLHAEFADPKFGPLVRLAGIDVSPSSFSHPPATANDIKHALDSIADAVHWRQYIAEHNIANLGASRGRHTKEAAENSAIWILAAGVYDAARDVPKLGKSGETPKPPKPHIPEIVRFANAILQTDTITADRVRLLVRRRRQLWLDQFGEMPVYSPASFRTC